MSEAKTRRLTARRKLFLSFVDAMRTSFGDYGVLSESCDDDVLIEELMELDDAAAHQVAREHRCDAMCSALAFLHSLRFPGDPGVEECSEQSEGGRVFRIAYDCGWSAGFKVGMKEAIKEASKAEPKK